MEKGFRKFKIDPEFKGLSQPLGSEEYRQLERSIVSDGCREPILVGTTLSWMGTTDMRSVTKSAFHMRPERLYLMAGLPQSPGFAAVSWTRGSYRRRRKNT